MKNNVKVKDETQSLQSCVSVSVTELRIGNLLHYNGNHKEVGKVTLLVADMINELSYCQLDHRRNKKHWLINLDAIPLTREWLLSFCFTATHYPYLRFHINLLETEIYLRPSLDKWYWGFVNDGNDCEINDCYELAFVHELQNLVFVLTKRDLTEH